MTYPGTMSDNKQTPDRAGSFESDGLDVPTYSGATEGPATPSRPDTPAPTPEPDATAATTQFPEAGGGLFDRTGRAAPQEIPPAQPHYADQDFAAPVTPDPTVAAAPTGMFTGTVAPEEAPAPVLIADPDPGSSAFAPADTPDHRRGTMDFGLLVIRLLLGLWLVLEAVGTFFRLGGNAGLAGLEAEYADYLSPAGLAIIVPSMQLAAGVFLILGLITPLLAMVATIATSFTALHALMASDAGLNIFAWPAAVWLSIVLLGISLALQFTGPGYLSLDYGRSWARRPLISSWVFVALAIAGAVALWWFGAGVSPLA